jgi:hypothetical protein
LRDVTLNARISDFRNRNRGNFLSLIEEKMAVLKQYLLLCLLISVSVGANGQVGCMTNFGRTLPGFEQGDMERFKRTETVFVLPEIFLLQIYEKILSENWTVTP